MESKGPTLRPILKFLWRGSVLTNFSNKWEQKHRTPDTYHYVSNDYAILKKFIKLAENTKKLRQKRLFFSKESVENADFYKPALNKIMTTYE